ncbi:MAG: sugar-transfer associated ATP-grasp domain-containing protein [Agriterribacter sp.]
MLKKMFHWINYMGYVGKNFSSHAKKQFIKDFKFVREKKRMSSIALFSDVLSSSIKNNMSPLEFFKLRLYDKSAEERSEYISARVLRKFQLQMNPAQECTVISDKIKFLAHFKDLIKRNWASVETLRQDKSLAEAFLNDEKGKIVLKNSRGMSGKQVKVVETKQLNVPDLITLMEENNFDLAEEFIIQHDTLMNIAPRGLNTIRVISQLQNEEVIIIGACLKLSIYESVDNLNSGNVAMPVELESGIVTDAGIFLDITKDDLKKHPLTGIDIIGFQVPFWKECIEIVKKGALLTPNNRSIGWDVAVTNNGPLLIEGNHNWGHDIWQMAYRKGFKKLIFQYMNN